MESAPKVEVSVRRLKRDVVMLVLTLVSLGIIGWVEVYDLDWPQPLFQHLAIVDLVLVLVFAVEFGLRLRKADSKRQFLIENWYEIPGLVPLYADSLSWLRATKVLRIIRIVRLFRIVSALQRIKRSIRFLNKVLSRSHLGTTFLVATTVVLVSAYAFWRAEHRINPALDSYDDAVWWAMSTTTTVGYGDIYPQTGAGRLVACVLMLVGIGLVGVIASTLAAALVRTEAEARRPESDLATQLGGLVTLRDQGNLSAEEFQRAKDKILGT